LLGECASLCRGPLVDLRRPQRSSTKILRERELPAPELVAVGTLVLLVAEEEARERLGKRRSGERRRTGKAEPAANSCLEIVGDDVARCRLTRHRGWIIAAAVHVLRKARKTSSVK